MLHSGAKTKLILTSLTDAFDVDFSVRQGDCISMILYIIYIEPLLLCIQAAIDGFPLVAPLRDQQATDLVTGAVEKQEAFVDDQSIIVTDDNDFFVVNLIVAKFEKLSGAILNRDTKSKVMGLGSWRGRSLWPLSWLSTVAEMKIFGYILHPCYDTMIKLNWEKQLEKFNSTLFSWESRVLDSLFERADLCSISYLV